MITSFSTGMFDNAEWFLSLTIIIENFAFIAGSSKQGKAERAPVGSKSVVARYLEKENISMEEHVQSAKIIRFRICYIFKYYFRGEILHKACILIF